MVFLGIDCGTQSLKVLVWNAEDESAQSVARPYGLLENLPPGHKEQDPAVWIEALDACLTELRARQAPLDRVAAIGVSGQQHGLVVLDGRDQVIRPAKLWNDTSTAAQCPAIVEAAGGLEAYQSEIGNSLPPGFTASKVLWIKQQEAHHYARIRSILLPHDYLNFYLTGRRTAEAGDASGTGYFRVRERQWSQRILAAIDPETDLSACLPELIGSDQWAGELRPALARQWGLPPHVPVSSGGGDNMMGAIGTGNVAPGVVTVSLGTSGTLYSYSDRPVIDPDGEIAAFCDSTGGWLPLGCTMNVTVATEMIRTGLLKLDHPEFSDAVATVPPGADGLILLPYLEGERMPSVPQGTGALLGLRPRTATGAHLARAAMEGVTLGLRYGQEKLKQLGIAPTEIRLIGGGARSPVWRQIVADIFQAPVACPRNQGGPAFGAALQAMWAARGGDIRELTRTYARLDPATRHEPTAEAMKTYDDLYALYLKLADALVDSDVFPVHRRLIEG